jgi:hypothetical protein
MKEVQVYELHKRFHDGCIGVNDDLHGWQLSSVVSGENRSCLL